MTSTLRIYKNALMRMGEIKEALFIRNDPYFTVNTKVAVVFRSSVVSANSHLWNPQDVLTCFL